MTVHLHTRAGMFFEYCVAAGICTAEQQQLTASHRFPQRVLVLRKFACSPLSSPAGRGGGHCLLSLSSINVATPIFTDVVCFFDCMLLRDVTESECTPSHFCVPSRLGYGVAEADCATGRSPTVYD